MFKITTSKMRCAIKVKEEFENVAGTIYVKMSVFERDILSSAWRSDPFLPSLSTRWDPNDSTIRIPLNDVSDLDHISIKVSPQLIITHQVILRERIARFEREQTFTGN